MNKSQSRRCSAAISSLLGCTLVIAAPPSVASGPDTAPRTLGAYDHISAIGTLGTTGRALIGVTDSATNAGQLWISDGSATTTVLVGTLNTEGDAAAEIVPLDTSRSLFRARGDNQGTELWVTDGTASGTQPVLDVQPGPGSSHPHEFTRWGDKIYFSANDGIHGRELWVTDGTSAGTTMVKDIRPGSSLVGPHSLTLSGDHLYFAADDGITGTELWRTDGTTAGTQIAKDVNPGLISSGPSSPVAVDGGVAFAATDSTGDRELWFSDGSDTGTVRIADIRPGAAGSMPNELTVVGDRVVFAADDGSSGTELWAASRSSGGWTTQSVADIRSGAGGSNPRDLLVAEDGIYFAAYDAIHGEELWRSDGTPVGTALVRDIQPGAGTSYPSIEATFRSHLLFTAFTDADGMEPWASDGTAAGTVSFGGVLAPGSWDSTPEKLHVAGSMLFYQAYDSANDANVLRALDLDSWFTGASDVPTIVGPARVGATVGVLPGGWDSGAELDYQWLRNGTLIPGASATTYTVQAQDHGRALAVQVSGARPGYTRVSRKSSDVIVAAGQLVASALKVKGKARVGKKLKAKPGAWEVGVSLQYQWLRKNKPIRGATKRNHRLTTSDRGKRITVRVTATKPGHDTVTLRAKRTKRVR